MRKYWRRSTITSNIKHLKQKIMSEQCKFKKGDKVKIVKNIHNNSSPKTGAERVIHSISKSTTVNRRHLWYIVFESLTNGISGGAAYNDEIELTMTRKESLIEQKSSLIMKKRKILAEIRDIDATLAIMKKHGVEEMSPELEKVFLISEEIEELNITPEKAENIARILAK
jgi:hypothetical protein